MSFAKKNGYSGDRLKGAIDCLEKKFPVPQDNTWSGKDIGVGSKSHHLDDLAHHPTLLGLASAVAVQLFRLGIFVNKNGKWHFEFISTKPAELLKIWLTVIISGLLSWMANIVESHFEDKLEEDIPKPIHILLKSLAAAPAAISILKVAGNWAGHLISDMGGSKNTAGGGMGIPGLFLSMLKEVSSLPFLNNTVLPKLVNDLYVKQKFDMRAELAVVNELGRQAVPVLIGEVLVRGFYFVRHLINEIKEHKVFEKVNWENVNWNNVIPFRNRTIARMMTIETGTFTAFDLIDAAARAAVKSGTTPMFFKDFLLRVNFVGVGRFVIAVGADIGMGIKKSSLQNKRMDLNNTQLRLANAKVFYKVADMWISAETAGETIQEAYGMMEETTVIFIDSINEMKKNMGLVAEHLAPTEQNNPGLSDDILNVLKWG